MFAATRRFNRLMRVVVLIVMFTSLSFTGQTAAAQPDRPNRVSQDVLDRLGIKRPQAANLTELSLQIAQ